MDTTGLPRAVAEVLGAAPTVSTAHEGMSGGVVLVDGRYWVKRGPHAIDEHARLHWLAGQGIALPEVVVFERDVLVLADAGAPSLARHPAPGALLGETLRGLHRLPIETCPFDGRLDTVLARAAERVAAGSVDPADYDFDHHGLAPEQILARLRDERPAERELVVAHGDYTPSNVLLGGIVIDVGTLGVADRYRDLALAVRDLRDDFGAGEVERFFAAYGLAEPDERRLEYYRLLDELF
ncbi:aminoglycoside 3'-phosphotransferase [Nocardia arthritidis]|uniref:Phosphotransferase n=1 Tax=Nocardia arthritidis TaxID=228602 RepID=A0A6G9YL80_9NOCA|nr:aminoglycoside 3'-phosphotransferase [Nocardia arthritidis]QIS13900.1 phosphotransferase [Nocardia arthritidis]